MAKTKKTVCTLTAVLLALMMTACSKFDAQGYTQAVLDSMFQGETEALMEFKDGSSKKELEEEYEEYIASFSESLTEGLEINDGMQLKFDALCKEIFRSARYNVGEAEKISREEYKVTVEIEPSDIFIKWKEYLEENAADISERAERGEYQGTEEEILDQMLLDITVESCELLDTALLNAEYGEKESVTLTIKKDEDGEFAPQEEEITDLVAKILRLDAIQG